MYFGIYFFARTASQPYFSRKRSLEPRFAARCSRRRSLPVILKFDHFSVGFENYRAELVRSDIRYVKLGKQRESFGMRVPIAVVFAAGNYSPLRVHRLKKIL